MTITKTAKANRAILLTMTSLISLGWSTASLGQAAADAPNDKEIVVTGSRVRGVAPVGSALTSIGREEITASGRVTLDRAIKELPQVLDLGVSENSRGQSGGAGNIVYGNSINLRGIGANATLMLIDGHRVVNNSRSNDPSVLPTLGVERVEVIADGASAIYGSDAVAGVVNLIPRRNLNGGEAFARAGVSADGAYHEYALGAAYGKKFERGQFMVAYEHVEKSALNGDDRNFFRSNQTAFGGNDSSTLRCAPGTIVAPVGAVSTNFAIPLGGVTAANAGALVAGTSNRCDDLQGQDLIPQQKYDSANATFSYDLTDWLTFFADGFYSRRTFVRQPGFANASLAVPTTNAFFVQPAGVTLPLCPASAGVPAGTRCETVNYNFRGDVARNTSFGAADNYQLTPGVRFKLPHDWQFEAILGFGKTSDNSSSLIGINNAALATALASGTAATSFDPFGLNRTTAATVGGIFNQIFLAPTIGYFTGYEARLNGPLFHLPGGDAKLAVGYEGQEFNVDLGNARGNPGTPIVYTYRGRRVDSLYAELYVPLFGLENSTPGFDKLEIVGAIRYDRYSDVGKTTNPKLGVNWAPIPGLTFHGSYGTSFRAPTLPQIFGNSSQLFVQNYTNPAGGATITGVAQSGGNLNLRPETASTWSMGFDFEPLPKLKFSATYFSVDYKNQVVALLSDLAVLTRASQYDGTGLIIQGAAAGVQVKALVDQGLAVSGAFPGGNPLNVTVFVDGRSQNLARSITKGIDFSVSYTMETAKAGTFGFNVNGTYLTSFRTAQSPGAPILDQLNQIFQPLRFKARASVNWQSGPFNAMVRVSHLNGYTNTSVTPNQAVKSYTPVDLNVSWKVGNPDKPFTFGLEVRNLFNIKPPYVNIPPSGNGSGGYDATAADPIGRLFAASVRTVF